MSEHDERAAFEKWALRDRPDGWSIEWTHGWPACVTHTGSTFSLSREWATWLGKTDQAATEIAALKARVASLEEALTPSGGTKAAYIGEFAFDFPTWDHDGMEVMRTPNVPWTTVKEIMAAIRKRAEATQAEGGSGG